MTRTLCLPRGAAAIGPGSAGGLAGAGAWGPKHRCPPVEMSPRLDPPAPGDRSTGVRRWKCPHGWTRRRLGTEAPVSAGGNVPTASRAGASGRTARPNLGNIKLLFVCTANMCRSPAAAAFMRQRMAERETNALVGSAGLLEGGHPCPQHLVFVMATYGLDLTEHRSRQLTPAIVEAADLIVTMERRHLREVALMSDEAFPRTFTLKELVRRGTDIGGRPAEQPIAEWMAKAHAERSAGDLLGASSEDDVNDPYLGSLEDYESTCRQLDSLTRALTELIWPIGSPAEPLPRFDDIHALATQRQQRARRSIRRGLGNW
jgi:protein-tyrosine phosphatase